MRRRRRPPSTSARLRCPVLVASRRRHAEDEVHVPGREPGLGHRGRRIGHVGRDRGGDRARPARGPRVDWTPSEIRVTPAPPVGAEALGGHVLGIALDGHLGARRRGARRRAPRPAGRRGKPGRGAAAEEDRGRRPACPRVDRPAPARSRRPRRTPPSGGRGRCRWRRRSSRSGAGRTGRGRRRRTRGPAPGSTTGTGSTGRPVRQETWPARTDRSRRSRWASMASVASADRTLFIWHARRPNQKLTRCINHVNAHRESGWN